MFFVIILIMFQTVVQAEKQRFENVLNKPQCKLYPIPVDLIFLVDGSSFVGLESFSQIKIFMGNVVNNFDISEDGLKVAVVQYASYHRTEFSLNSLKTKENTLTMLEMLEYLNGTSKFIGEGIKYISLKEIQISRGSRKEANKIVVLLTDGFSQDDVKQVSDQGRDLGVEYFAVTVTQNVDYKQLFDITKDLKEHVFKLDKYETLISVIQNRLVKRVCDELQSDTGKNEVTKKVDYTVSCEKKRITVTVKTVEPFKGKIFIQGFSESKFCRQLQDTFAVNETTMLLMVPTNDCGVRAGYQLHPPGTYLEAKMVVSFHPVFITKMDQVLNVQCFFSENSTTFNSLMLSKSDIKTKVFYPITPSCSYTIRLNSEDGPQVSMVSVGQKVFHVWQCDVDNANFSIHVHSCSVDNGQESKTTITDDRGCTDDFDMWPSVNYRKSQTKVWQEMEAFKFSGPTLVYFTCRIGFCDIGDIYCQKSYSPLLNCKTKSKIRSVNNDIRSSQYDVDVYTRINVLHMEGNDDHYENQAITSVQLSVVCFNTVHLALSLILILITWISFVSYCSIRLNIKRNIYVIYSNSKRLLCCCEKPTDVQRH